MRMQHPGIAIATTESEGWRNSETSDTPPERETERELALLDSGCVSVISYDLSP